MRIPLLDDLIARFVPGSVQTHYLADGAVAKEVARLIDVRLPGTRRTVEVTKQLILVTWSQTPYDDVLKACVPFNRSGHFIWKDEFLRPQAALPPLAAIAGGGCRGKRVVGGELMLSAHDILRFRRRQASMRIYNHTLWHRGNDDRWVWTLELVDDDDDAPWLLSSGGKGVQLCRRGSPGMAAVQERLWRSVLESHRPEILAWLTKELARALRQVDELRDAIKELKR